MKDFKRLQIWKFGMEIAVETYQMSTKLPNEEKFGLRSQITRAAVSIPANIAEGSGRGTDFDYNRFINYALGSSYELETLFIVIKKTQKAINNIHINKLIKMTREEQKMLIAFKKKLAA